MLIIYKHSKINKLKSLSSNLNTLIFCIFLFFLIFVFAQIYKTHLIIALLLQKVNPHWDQDRIYLETRRIVGAVIQNSSFLNYRLEVNSSSVS
ncbi:hypothetical protein Mgra_00008354 [Meloidogyne graminicola]|uniref:Uncharacterized protein n=1 Tax=Meloidogyne graminicola TaxID=189291 RepID=A0A8S9ZG29_9BILA|nr:hypothetical protein Mgra_00008354 [Meloidogyne graminicola]